MNKFYVLFLLVAVLFSSCNDSVKKDKSEVLYFGHESNCFDFTKRCKLEVAKIKNDTIIYVRSSQHSGQYDEIHGSMTKVNDSIFFVKTFEHLQQIGNRWKPYRVTKDTLYFYCDSNLINSKLTIEYLNGQIDTHTIYSTTNAYWINENLFTEKDDRIYLTFGHKNPIVDELVEVAYEYSIKRYSTGFRSFSKPYNFYMVISDDHIKTLSIANDYNSASGTKFKLRKFEKSNKLQGGRVIYED